MKDLRGKEVEVGDSIIVANQAYKNTPDLRIGVVREFRGARVYYDCVLCDKEHYLIDSKNSLRQKRLSERVVILHKSTRLEETRRFVGK